MIENKGMVFNIQRYSIDDGPGIRTTVFLKGCPLRCRWCSNPESQDPKPEIMYRATSCKFCKNCIKACKKEAIIAEEKGVLIDRNLCIRCGKCEEVCLYKAIELMGKRVSVDEVMNVIKKDIHFYQDSGGGVTISGGEALFQPNFTEALLKECHELGIHTCLDTSGYGSTSDLKRILEYTDLVYYDIKLVDPFAHKEYTGQSNELILHNLKVVVDSGKQLVIRIPVIPGINDSSEEITAIAEKVISLTKTAKVHLLPYHRYGMGKYKALDREYKMGDVDRPSDELLERVKKIFESFYLECEIRK
ncbi:pyruvate-formate lyase-activating enzyme [Pelotomaculum thermopropionicum SI]|uniref:Pyruvate-formate lyase-activating enzyme n=1 Tax=Pelotomaculum thermopropionicum (strain DSM 13744 / JCM 10971 / SI) TaxID=370438 RepID=A5CZJ9_PELTS|nr:pyruvate-formate lyase-activating enzyme [Pelotomaculum thermopropionicum SI]